ncbi:PREDICTED: uncharacterized protein YML079W-like [Acropora digitifera]|uniref:uncharacterized protein YML079W-like n=1 Tax=Acropora digitifera TaxID=70779 RepID=UPI00077A057F|nr:PREDICTED: uncharacterized protein YML079W-like [Acropora digitifera]
MKEILAMNHRRDIYIEKLGLIALSEEGGYFVETHRSPEEITVRKDNQRSLFTTIYYLMEPELGGKNFLNSNKSDITHFFHDGWPAKYIYVTPDGKVEEFTLGNDILKGHVLQKRVPGGCLKAARILMEEDGYAKFPGEIPFTLISEKMTPGFDFRDRSVPTGAEVKKDFPHLWPQLEEFIAPEKENQLVDS